MLRSSNNLGNFPGRGGVHPIRPRLPVSLPPGGGLPGLGNVLGDGSGTGLRIAPGGLGSILGGALKDASGGNRIGKPKIHQPPAPQTIQRSNGPPGNAVRGTARAVISSVDNANTPKYATVLVENHIPGESGYAIPAGWGPFAAGGTAGFNYYYNNSSGVGGSWVLVDLDRKMIMALDQGVSTSPATPYYKAITDHKHSGNLNPDGFTNPQPVDLSSNESQNQLPYGQNSSPIQSVIDSTGNVLSVEFPGGKLQSDQSVTNVSGTSSAMQYTLTAGQPLTVSADIASGGSGLNGLTLGNETNGYEIRRSVTGLINIKVWVGGVSTTIASGSTVALDSAYHTYRLTVTPGTPNIIEGSYDGIYIGPVTDSSLTLTSGTWPVTVFTGGSTGKLLHYASSAAVYHYGTLPTSIQNTINSNGQILNVAFDYSYLTGSADPIGPGYQKVAPMMSPVGAYYNAYEASGVQHDITKGPLVFEMTGRNSLPNSDFGVFFLASHNMCQNSPLYCTSGTQNNVSGGWNAWTNGTPSTWSTTSTSSGLNAGLEIKHTSGAGGGATVLVQQGIGTGQTNVVPVSPSTSYTFTCNVTGLSDNSAGSLGYIQVQTATLQYTSNQFSGTQSGVATVTLTTGASDNYVLVKLITTTSAASSTADFIFSNPVFQPTNANGSDAQQGYLARYSQGNVEIWKRINSGWARQTFVTEGSDPYGATDHTLTIVVTTQGTQNNGTTNVHIGVQYDNSQWVTWADTANTFTWGNFSVRSSVANSATYLRNFSVSQGQAAYNSRVGASQRRNLILNGNNTGGKGTFNPNGYGWTKGPATVTSGGSYPLNGQTFTSIENTAGGRFQWKGQLIPVIPGKTYTICALLYASTGAQTAFGVFDSGVATGWLVNNQANVPLGTIPPFYQAALGNCLPGQYTTSASNTWQFIYQTFVVPNNNYEAMALWEQVSTTANSVFTLGFQIYEGNVLQDYIDHEPNPGYLSSSSPLNQQGAIINWQGVPAVSYSYTTTSVQVSVAGATLKRTDGSTVTVPSVTFPNKTGLAASTTYYWDIYYDVVNNVFNNTYYGTSQPTSSQIFSDGYVDGRVSVYDNYATATPASGSGSGGGGTGSGGGGVQCPADYQLVKTRDRGYIRADQVDAGDYFPSLDGWVEVLEAVKMPAPIWRYTIERDGVQESFDVNETHAAMSVTGEWLEVRNMKPGDLIVGKDGDFRVVDAHFVKDGHFIAFDVEGHTFTMGEALVHNFITRN